MRSVLKDQSGSVAVSPFLFLLILLVVVLTLFLGSCVLYTIDNFF